MLAEGPRKSISACHAEAMQIFSVSGVSRETDSKPSNECHASGSVDCVFTVSVQSTFSQRSVNVAVNVTVNVAEMLRLPAIPWLPSLKAKKIKFFGFYSEVHGFAGPASISATLTVTLTVTLTER